MSRNVEFDVRRARDPWRYHARSEHRPPPYHCGSTARPYGHRTSSPPRRRLLDDRLLESHLSLRAQTLSPDHRDANNTATVHIVVAVLLPSSLWGRLIRFFRENSHASLREYTKKRNPPVEKIPPRAAPSVPSSVKSPTFFVPLLRLYSLCDFYMLVLL